MATEIERSMKENLGVRLLGLLDAVRGSRGGYDHELLARLEHIMGEASREPLFLSLASEDRAAIRRFIEDITYGDTDRSIEVTMGFEIGYRYALAYGWLGQRDPLTLKQTKALPKP